MEALILTPQVDDIEKLCENLSIDEIRHLKNKYRSIYKICKNKFEDLSKKQLEEGFPQFESLPRDVQREILRSNYHTPFSTTFLNKDIYKLSTEDLKKECFNEPTTEEVNEYYKRGNKVYGVSLNGDHIEIYHNDTRQVIFLNHTGRVNPYLDKIGSDITPDIYTMYKILRFKCSRYNAAIASISIFRKYFRTSNDLFNIHYFYMNLLALSIKDSSYRTIGKSDKELQNLVYQIQDKIYNLD